MKRSLLSISMVFVSCAGNKQFTQGEYGDVSQSQALDDRFNETDVSLLAEEMINSMANHPIFADAKVPPVVQVETVRNKTSEHVDTKAITDTIRTALIRTGRVRFTNKEDRENVQEEIDYQQDSGRVRKDTARQRGRAIGADYIVSGDLISNVQEAGDKKQVYYRLTLNLTNLDSGIIEWSEEKPILKKYRKKSVGL